MKIGKYPVKHTYKVSRIVADVISLGLVVLIVSSTISFFQRYDEFYSLIDTSNPEVLATLTANDPNYQWKQWLALIFPVLAVGILTAYIVLVLKSHKFSRYAVTKRNAQDCYDALAFCASLCKIPALVIVFDIMCIAQDKLLPQYGFSWFSWSVILYALLIAILIRYTSHRIATITAKPEKTESNTIKVKAVAVSEKKDTASKDNAPENDKNTKEDL